MKLLLEGIKSTINAAQVAAVISPSTPAGPLFGLNGPAFKTYPESKKTIGSAAPTTPPYPYLNIDVEDGDCKWFFSTNYVEKCTVIYTVFDISFINAAGWIDKIATLFDRNRFSITPDVINIALRKKSAKPQKDVTYDAQLGKSVYSWSVSYDYQITRST